MDFKIKNGWNKGRTREFIVDVLKDKVKQGDECEITKDEMLYILVENSRQTLNIMRIFLVVFVILPVLFGLYTIFK